MSSSEVFAKFDPAYLAGFLDARGCISVSGDQVQVIVGSKQLAKLEWLVTQCGGHIHQASASKNRLAGIRAYYEWRLAARPAALAILEAIRPHLVVKAAQADAALAVLRRAAA